MLAIIFQVAVVVENSILESKQTEIKYFIELG